MASPLTSGALGGTFENPVLVPPGSAVAATKLAAETARRAGRFDDAERLLEQALAIEPANPLLWFERGTVAFQAGALERACQHYRRAAELDPNLGEAHLNVGGVLEQLERQAEGLAWARQAVELLPHNPIAHYNLANIHRALADLPTSIRSFERALALDPHYHKVHWNLATCYLLQGNFALGWEKYEWRSAAGAVALDRYPQPRWDGSSPAGKTLLVHAEQGIGDEILFASCVGDLLERGARVILVCDPRLEALFRRSFPAATVYGYARRKDGQPLALAETVDWQIPAGSLPLYLRSNRQSFPRRKQFLAADPAQVAAWRERFDALGGGLKIGISWRAGGRTSERRRRTTEFDLWQPLFALTGAHWINLQYGEADEEIAAARERHGITIHDWPDGDPLVDLDGFAARIAALDLVISVGNATTHMAGALGAQAWVLLPLVPAWRWMIAGERSPWYESLRLFRQPSLADWQPPFERVCENLKALLAEQQPDPASRSAVAGVCDRGCPTINVTNSTHDPASPRPAAVEVNPATGKLTRTENERFDSVQDDRVLADVVIPRVLDEAIAKHRAGQFAEAETIYRQILRRAPRQADALHLLGVVARQTGRVELAIQSIRRALAIVDTEPTMHFNLGNALADAGRHEAAISSYRRAIELDSSLGEAHLNLALSLQCTGRAVEAVDAFRASARLLTGSAEAQWNLGNALRLAGQVDEAIECYENAIGLNPKMVKAYSGLAGLLLEEGRPQEALAMCHGGLEIDPGHASSHHVLAEILRALDRPSEALVRYGRALDLEPRRFDSLHNLAHLLQSRGEPVAAEAYYRRALEVRPYDPHAHNSLGQSLEEQGRWQEALASYERAIEHDPQHALAHTNAALARLQLGDYARGWDEYEWRWRCPDGPRARNYFAEPLWDGAPLDGKSILIHGEQGLGDEIMFASCVPDLGAAHTVLACDYRLAPLFRRSFREATVVPMRRTQEHCCKCRRVWQSTCTFPPAACRGTCGAAPASFPRHAHFLTPDTPRMRFWHERFPTLGAGLQIGISWRAGNTPKDRRTRWTRIEEWRGLLTLPGTHFVNLQYGDCQDDLAAIEETCGVHVHSWPECDPKQDVDELAAQIAALDLVVSVANANVHLAGALGVPAWALVPYPPRWAWGLLHGDHSMWYASVRVFRQQRPGDWSDCFRAIVDELQLQIAQTADNHQMSPIVAGSAGERDA